MKPGDKRELKDNELLRQRKITEDKKNCTPTGNQESVDSLGQKIIRIDGKNGSISRKKGGYPYDGA